MFSIDFMAAMAGTNSDRQPSERTADEPVVSDLQFSDLLTPVEGIATSNSSTVPEQASIDPEVFVVHQSQNKLRHHVQSDTLPFVRAETPTDEVDVNAISGVVASILSLEVPVLHQEIVVQSSDDTSDLANDSISEVASPNAFQGESHVGSDSDAVTVDAAEGFAAQVKPEASIEVQQDKTQPSLDIIAAHDSAEPVVKLVSEVKATGAPNHDGSAAGNVASPVAEPTLTTPPQDGFLRPVLASQSVVTSPSSERVDTVFPSPEPVPTDLATSVDDTAPQGSNDLFASAPIGQSPAQVVGDGGDILRGDPSSSAKPMESAAVVPVELPADTVAMDSAATDSIDVLPANDGADTLSPSSPEITSSGGSVENQVLRFASAESSTQKASIQNAQQAVLGELPSSQPTPSAPEDARATAHATFSGVTKVPIADDFGRKQLEISEPVATSDRSLQRFEPTVRSTFAGDLGPKFDATPVLQPESNESPIQVEQQIELEFPIANNNQSTGTVDELEVEPEIANDDLAVSDPSPVDESVLDSEVADTVTFQEPGESSESEFADVADAPIPLSESTRQPSTSDNIDVSDLYAGPIGDAPDSGFQQSTSSDSQSQDFSSFVGTATVENIASANTESQPFIETARFAEHAPRVAQQVATTLSEVTSAQFNEISDGQSEISRSVSLKLQPEELGQLTVHIHQTAEAVSAQIIATEQVASELLQNQKEILVEALADLGFEDASVDISHHKEDRSGASPQHNGWRDAKSGSKRSFGGGYAASDQPKATIEQTTNQNSPGLNILA